MPRRIRILQGISGDGFSWAPGDLVDLDDEEAGKWADGYRAELAHDVPARQEPQEEPVHTEPDPAVEHPAYDPGTHTVAQVLAYLDGAGEQEVLRVLQAEENGQARRGIASQRESLLAAARADDEELAARRAELAEMERAAEASRGGGRGPAPETR